MRASKAKRWPAGPNLSTSAGSTSTSPNRHTTGSSPPTITATALLRRHVCKGADLSVYTLTDLRAIELRIITMPHRGLQWSTAHGVYTHAVTMTG